MNDSGNGAGRTPRRPEQRTSGRLKRKYGLTPDDVGAMNEAQGGLKDLWRGNAPVRRPLPHNGARAWPALSELQHLPGPG